MDLTLVVCDTCPPRVQEEDCQMFIHAEDVKYEVQLHPSAQSSRARIYGINKPASSALFSNDAPADALVLARRSPASTHAAIIPQPWNNFQYFHLLCLITNKAAACRISPAVICSALDVMKSGSVFIKSKWQSLSFLRG